jgi:major membrane immunogen (membrane-anchored lipoprotein)
MKKFLVLVMVLAILITGCTDADIASTNLSKAADSFEVNRRIVFYNGITGEYMLEIDGLCSLGNSDLSGELSVTCKTGDGLYKKHYLGLSDNVTYFVEQIESVEASPYYYRVIFKPSVIIPDIDLQLP